MFFILAFCKGETMQSFFAAVRAVTENKPLVHCITNYVTIRDCANMLLACGASPIMADDPLESGEITALSSGLVLNIGTLHERTVDAMLISGKTANERGIPVILDPVGVGASPFRRQTAKTLLSEIRFSVIRGNLSEIRSLCDDGSCFRGVDANLTDLAADCVLEAVSRSRFLAAQIGAVVAVSGAVDVISDEKSSCLIHNGSTRMAKITGSGCMLSAVTGAFAAAMPQNIRAAVEAAFLVYDIAGEIAAERTGDSAIGSFRIALFDAVEQLMSEGAEKELERRARYERI